MISGRLRSQRENREILPARKGFPKWQRRKRLSEEVLILNPVQKIEAHDEKRMNPVGSASLGRARTTSASKSSRHALIRTRLAGLVFAHPALAQDLAYLVGKFHRIKRAWG